MKIQLITFILLMPMVLIAQNYEQQGDELFAQAQYDKAVKKYRAAIELSGTSAVLNEKLSSADQCKSLLSQANIAEEAFDYASAHKYYSQLYAIHPLPSYKNKIASYKSKASTAQVPTKKSHSYSVDERREVLKRIQSKINNIGFITGIWDGGGAPKSALFHDFYRSRNNNRNETFTLDVVFCQDGSFQFNIFTRDSSTPIIKKMIVDDQLFGEYAGTINDPVYRYATYPAGTPEDKIVNDANYVLRKLLQYRDAHLDDTNHQVTTKKSHSYSVDERREVLKRIQSKINNIGFITGIWDGGGAPKSALFHDFYRSRNNNRNETFTLDVVFCQDGSFQFNIFTRDSSTPIIKKMIVDDQLFGEYVGTINDPVYRYATYPAGTPEDKIVNDVNYVLRKLLQYRNAHL